MSRLGIEPGNTRSLANLVLDGVEEADKDDVREQHWRRQLLQAVLELVQISTSQELLRGTKNILRNKHVL